MYNTVADTTYSQNGKLYAEIKKENIRAEIDEQDFKTDKQREKAYDKQIKIFDYTDGCVDGVNEEEILAYDKKEKQKKTWITIGLIAAGIGVAVATYFACKGRKTITQNGTILPIEHAKSKPNLIDAYDIPGERYKYFNGNRLFDADNMRFVDESNPLMLEKKSIKANEQVIFISNFDEIGGTIAATTDLKKCIATDRMYQCAGLSVVDRSLNKQSLIHVYPGYSVESNKEIISKILFGSDPKNLEISIVPGCKYYTEDTVAFLANVTKELAPNAKINFCNFPNYSHYSPDRLPKGHTIEQCVEHIGGKAAIWLQNGKLFCCDNNAIPNKIINPKNFITYFG